MASKLSISIGPVTGEAVIGGASDLVIGQKVKAWAVGMGVADAGDSNQQVAHKVAAWVRDQMRREVARWHVAEAREAFEQSSQAAGAAYFDTEV